MSRVLFGFSSYYYLQLKCINLVGLDFGGLECSLVSLLHWAERGSCAVHAWKPRRKRLKQRDWMASRLVSKVYRHSRPKSPSFWQAQLTNSIGLIPRTANRANDLMYIKETCPLVCFLFFYELVSLVIMPRHSVAWRMCSNSFLLQYMPLRTVALEPSGFDTMCSWTLMLKRFSAHKCWIVTDSYRRQLPDRMHLSRIDLTWSHYPDLSVQLCTLYSCNLN